MVAIAQLLSMNNKSARELNWLTPAVYVTTFAPALLLLLVSITQSHVPFEYLSKDPLTVAGMATAANADRKCCPAYYGLVSNVGILVWWSVATVCLFAGTLLILCRGDAVTRHDGTRLLAAGLFTGWLTLDDLFLVHEKVLPALGIPQLAVYGAYALMALAFAFYSRALIWNGRRAMFGLAIALLSTSVAIDVIVSQQSTASIILEDGAKLLGIVAWASFYIETATRLLLGKIFAP